MMSCSFSLLQGCSCLQRMDLEECVLVCTYTSSSSSWSSVASFSWGGRLGGRGQSPLPPHSHGEKVNRNAWIFTFVHVFIFPSLSFLLLPSPSLSSPLLPSPSLSSPLLPSPSLSSPLLPSPSLSFPLLPSPSLSSPLLPSPSLSFPLLPSPSLSFPLLPSPPLSSPPFFSSAPTDHRHHTSTTGPQLS